MRTLCGLGVKGAGRRRGVCGGALDAVVLLLCRAADFAVGVASDAAFAVGEDGAVGVEVPLAEAAGAVVLDCVDDALAGVGDEGSLLDDGRADRAALQHEERGALVAGGDGDGGGLKDGGHTFLSWVPSGYPANGGVLTGAQPIEVAERPVIAPPGGSAGID